MKELFDDAFAPEETVVTAPEQQVEYTLLGLDDCDALLGEIAQLESAMQVAEQTAVSLESLAITIGATQEEGGLTTQGAILASEAANAIVAPLGITIEMPSLESFGEEGGRANATQFSLEGIKATAQKIWQGIKRFVSKWVKKVVEFVVNTKGSAEKLAKAADALELAGKNKDGSPAEAKLSMAGSQFAAITKDGKTINLSKDLKELTQMIGKIKKGGAGFDAAEAMLETLKGFSITKDNVGTELEIPGNPIEAGLKGLGFTEFKGNDKRFSSESNTYLVSETILGNRMVVATLKKGKEGNIKNVVIKAVEADTGLKIDKKKDVDALDQTGVQSVAGDVAELARAIADSKLDGALGEKVVDMLLKEGDRLAKEITAIEKEEGVSKDDIEKARAALNDINRYATVVFEPTASLQRAALASAKQAYKYAKSSLSNIKEEKKD